jgi:hypothetical protein
MNALRPPAIQSTPWALLLHAEGPLEIYYGPFEHVNTAARLVIVGMTPSKTETVAAFERLARALNDGLSHADALRQVKRQASFVGLRGNLAAMLDGLDLSRHLGLASTAELFSGARAELLHPTAVVRDPVLWHGANYSGHTPPLMRSPALRRYLDDVLAPELESIPDGLVVPLGQCVSAALLHLVAQGRLDAGRCLFGFPHPSGANARRYKQYRAIQFTLRQAVADWFALSSCAP